MSYLKLLNLLDKFASLTDEQYKLVFRSPDLLYILDNTNKLDEFYKSMPELPKEEIKKQIEDLKISKNNTTVPEEAELFFKKYNDKYFLKKLISQVNINIINDEVYTEGQAMYISNFLINSTIGDILKKYIDSSFYVKSDLLDFITNYNLIYELYVEKDELNDNEKEIMNNILYKLSSDLEIIIKSIFASETAYTKMLDNYLDAYKIRESDDFDFIKEYIEKERKRHINYTKSPTVNGPRSIIDKEPEVTVVL